MKKKKMKNARTKKRIQLMPPLANALVVLSSTAEDGEIEVRISEEEIEQTFLDAAEEKLLLRQHESHLKDFCRRFSPPMPRSVLGTAFHYFKRFYIHNSVMDYHPKEILVTCVYLACKVEEFNVSIAQFVSNIRGDREKASNIILNNELLLMQQLNYNLTIHNPFRPMEGLLIDIKTRSSLKDPERLRCSVEELLERTFQTDACLLYAPSQIALAAILHSASRLQENLDSYVTGTLFGQHGADKLPNLIECVRSKTMIKSVDPPPRESMVQLEKKLDKCRNQENNPDSQIYKQRMQDMLDEEDDQDNQQHYTTLLNAQAGREDQLVNYAQALSPPGS
uniref:Cyclin-H n=1 Tax=Timema genevievae TaxID=629358 RepID=A0A7R9JP17_TIMGE|nr:unnamed protein product [Timema genevievae]